MRGSFVRLRTANGSRRRQYGPRSSGNSNNKTRRALPMVCVVTVVVLLVSVVFVASRSSRKQNKDVLLATSSMLGVSEESLLDLAAAPLNVLGVSPSADTGGSSTDSSADRSSSWNNATDAPRNTILLTERPKRPIVIGYAFSILKCSDRHSAFSTIIDAALVLRHGIHLTSSRSNNSKKKAVSHYDYQMIAIVHSNADRDGCVRPLRDAGFTIVVQDAPIARDEIEGDGYLRKSIANEWSSGGEQEFIKLYAYTIENLPIVVHVDLDFVALRPMDDIFDAMLYSKESDIGRQARARIPTEFPLTTTSTSKKTMTTTTQSLPPPRQTTWPDRIDAVMTRGWSQVIPGRKAGFQPGLLIIKPNPELFDLIIDVIRKGDYVEGFGRENGWGGQGYGGFVGAKTLSGLLAYVYDFLLYDSWVELNQCRFNHLGADVKFRSGAGFRKSHAQAGQCRNNHKRCEDCQITRMADIYNVHYHHCREPWACIGEGSTSSSHRGSSGQKMGDSATIPEDHVRLDHCLQLVTQWHTVRTDLERRLIKFLGVKSLEDRQKGQYKKAVFQGHCNGYGAGNYTKLVQSASTIRQISQMYSKQSAG